MKYFVTVAVVFILSGCNSNSAPETSIKPECTFDQSYYSINRYKKNPLVKLIDWTEEQKRAAIITTEGDLVKIQHWSCRHYGVEARMYLEKSGIEEADLTRKFNALASISMDADEIGLVDEAVSKMQLSLDQNSLFDIPSETYSEFYTSVDSSDDTLILTIKYYGN